MEVNEGQRKVNDSESQGDDDDGEAELTKRR